MQKFCYLAKVLQLRGFTGMHALIIGNSPIRLDSASSTNTWVLQACRAKQIASGTLVYTHQQTEGRGQRGATWESAAGVSLTATLAYKIPSAFSDPELAPLLNMAIANACFDYLTWREAIEPAIKWPNDLFLGNKKVGGILIENVLERNQVTWSAIGIGINLNQPEFPDTLQRACSLYQQTGKEYKVDEEIPILSQNLERWLFAFQTGKFQHIELTYNKRLYGRDYRHLFEDLRETAKINGHFLGSVVRVDRMGVLWLELEDGTQVAFQQKELGWIWT